nr:MAG TPA: hypothetical protein [Caudoviricetes sp.]
MLSTFLCPSCYEPPFVFICYKDDIIFIRQNNI